MQTYLIRLEMRCHQYVTVKANSKDEARELAESGEGEQEEVDFGDSEAVYIEELK